MLCFCVFLQLCRRSQTTLCHVLAIITLLFPVYSGQHSLPPSQAAPKRPSELSQDDLESVGRESKEATHTVGIGYVTSHVHRRSVLDNAGSGKQDTMQVLVTPKIDELVEGNKFPFPLHALLGRRKFRASSRSSLDFSDDSQNRNSVVQFHIKNFYNDGKRTNVFQTSSIHEHNPRLNPQTPIDGVEMHVDFDTLARKSSEENDQNLEKTLHFAEPATAPTVLVTRKRRSLAQNLSVAEELKASMPPKTSRTPRRNTPLEVSLSPAGAEFEVYALLAGEMSSNFSSDLQVNASAPGNDTSPKKRICKEWTGGQYTMYQIGNLMCLVAFLVPHNFRASGVLMRSSLVGAMALFSAWASVRLCALDMLLWYVALTAVNLVHAFRLGYVLWPARITPELTDVYDKLFRPLKVPRVPFMQLAREGKIERMSAGHVYAEEDITVAGQRLAIVVSGRLSVSCDSTHLHYIFPNQFADSPEWETNRHVEQPTELFQVTVVSDEASILLVWQRDKLLSVLADDESLNAVIHNLVGRDITTKLYSLTEQPEQQRSNSASMLMPGDRVRPLLRGATVGPEGAQGLPPPGHSGQMQPARQMLDSVPGTSEMASKKATSSGVKNEISPDGEGSTTAHPRYPELNDQTTPSVINGANQAVQISREDTHTPHPRSTARSQPAPGHGSNTEEREPNTGSAQKDKVMRLVSDQSITHSYSSFASPSHNLTTDLLHDSYTPSSLLSDPGLVETAV